MSNLDLLSLLRRLAAEIDEAVTYAALGEDVLGIGRVFLDLLPQVVDVQAHIMRLIPVLVSPDFCQDLVVGNHPAGVLDQVIEQTVLGWPQLDELAIHPHFAAVEVDLEAVVYFDNAMGEPEVVSVRRRTARTRLTSSRGLKGLVI